MNSFFRGLGLGAGFAVSILVIALVSSKLKLFDDQPHVPDVSNIQSDIEQGEKWRALSYDEQIIEASALVISLYSTSDDESRVATVSEILKDDESIVVPAAIGQLQHDLKYYPDDGVTPRNGAIRFYTGSPAKERSTLYIYENRVAGYGDMPLDLLIKKFKEKKLVP